MKSANHLHVDLFTLRGKVQTIEMLIAKVKQCSLRPTPRLSLKVSCTHFSAAESSSTAQCAARKDMLVGPFMFTLKKICYGYGQKIAVGYVHMSSRI